MQTQLMSGMKVKSSDGKSLGKIIRVDEGTFLVEKGFFSPKDYIVPVSLVREVREGECWLAMGSEELERQRDAGIALDTRVPPGEGPRGEAAAGGFASTEAEGEQRMTLSEEELEARKRVRGAGEVIARKEVVTERRQIDVPVTHEEVHVERAPASASSTPAGEPFREETIRVPVREEEIEVTRRPRVREEVRVSKAARQEERRVEGEVRREEARIEGSDDVERRSPEEGDAPGRGVMRDDEP